MLPTVEWVCALQKLWFPASPKCLRLYEMRRRRISGFTAREKGFLRSIPTKAFEYMATSLPMIMSDFPLWRDLFHECALFVNPLDPHDIAEKMTMLIDDVELRRRLGRAGRQLVS